MANGKKVWFFADGYLPEKQNGIDCHEALMLFNANECEAEVVIDIYFSDRDPVKGIKVTVGAERVKTLRLDHSEDTAGYEIPPLTQYSLRITSSVPIVSQFGRLDVGDYSYYVNTPYWED
ncbi:MAG: hypothetical protein KBT47_09275 [Armatimonadetes bacterium]|nr:hypothetical protein [Candidatus Hippobium faecium]